MKSINAFLIAFGTTLLLLFAHAWSTGVLGYVWIAAVTITFLGGFVWLFFHVVLELLSQFKGARAKAFALVSLLALFALTVVLSGFYAWTFILAFVLFCGIAWRGLQDFRDLCRPHSSQQGPANWQRLERGEIPVASDAQRQRAKERFAHSCELHITCTPRISDLGLSSHPLRMDE